MNTQDQIKKPLSGWAVLAMFVGFFGVVIAVNTVYITTALKSNSGVVTENYYKEGIHYNDILEKAKNQPDVQAALSYKDGVLVWSLKDEAGKPIENADVKAGFIRPVKEGQDFEIPLLHIQSGLYSSEPEVPAKGQWIVKLDAKWDTKEYQTKQTLYIE